MLRILHRNRDRVMSLANHWAFKRPVDFVRNQSQRLDDIEQRLTLAIDRLVTIRKQHTHRLETTLNALDPTGVLRRGYSIARRLPEGEVLRDSKSAEVGNRISVTLHRGKLEAEVQKVQ
jgi:exodeoxyribonuclease VII large subunit